MQINKDNWKQFHGLEVAFYDNDNTSGEGILVGYHQGVFFDEDGTVWENCTSDVFYHLWGNKVILCPGNIGGILTGKKDCGHYELLGLDKGYHMIHPHEEVELLYLPLEEVK